MALKRSLLSKISIPCPVLLAVSPVDSTIAEVVGTPLFDLVGPNRAVQIFGVKFVGATADNGRKLLLTLGAILILWTISLLLKRLVRAVAQGRGSAGTIFWSRQTINLVTAGVTGLSILSIWFDDPRRLTTAVGLLTAALVFALQRVVTAWAGYFVILRAHIFNVGDRITMGGVRGDVISLGFTRTTVMEMGQPPAVKMADPAMWVEARQYTGRVVTITNDKVFDEPVYNYTRTFPYLWEELHVPIPYRTDRRRAEQILLDIATRHAVALDELGAEALQELQRRYFVRRSELRPRVYYRLTDNWLEMAVRFITREYGIREIKDAMSREIIEAFDSAGIEIASSTHEITRVPTIEIKSLQR